MTIAYHLGQVLQRIAESVNKFDRSAPSKVRLIAVSKTRTASEILEACRAGQKDFGENYLQEALEKIERLKTETICWHFIGPIQSNKTASIAEHFDWVQSVDRLKIARRLSSQRPKGLSPLYLCIQVNISEEETKSGVLPSEVLPLAEEVVRLPNIKLRGLMAIPAKAKDFDEQFKTAKKMALLFNQLKARYPDIDTLSLGMSQDLEAAIAAGSTMVRVGTDIFGARN